MAGFLANLVLFRKKSEPIWPFCTQKVSTPSPTYPLRRYWGGVRSSWRPSTTKFGEMRWIGKSTPCTISGFSRPPFFQLACLLSCWTDYYCFQSHRFRAEADELRRSFSIRSTVWCIVLKQNIAWFWESGISWLALSLSLSLQLSDIKLRFEGTFI